MPGEEAAAGSAPQLLTGWGRTSPSACDVVHPQHAAEVRAALQTAPPRGGIARGLGRSYGDAAQNGGGLVLDCTGLRSIGSVSGEGLVTVGGGAPLDDLSQAVVPQGWFIPVSPGTRFVTVGGAIAADVHGKNHHRDGSFCRHVTSMTLALPSGEVCTVTPEDGAELFWATAGGMGLTGVVVQATIRLLPVQSRFLLVDTNRTRDLDETMALMEQGDEAYRYSVAWLDLTSRRSPGRGVLTRGDHAPATALPASSRSRALDYRPRTRLAAPPWAPPWLVNRLSVRTFNEVWFRKAPAERRAELQSIEAFFYPLDAAAAWNRVYGRRGFLQYQCVVPFGAEETLRHIVSKLAAAPAAPALTVLKRFGEASPSPLSFPIPGWTLAVDFPAARGSGLDAVLDECDRLVVDAGGRVYLAKDARMRQDLLRLMYPHLDEWRKIVRRVDPHRRLASDLDRRLDLTGTRRARKQG
ncbi:MAG: FAD-binding protein [Dehalococcoidia bacterium]|nr:FAD-binding protein [Dehalococcoidia bacterium]